MKSIFYSVFVMSLLAAGSVLAAGTFCVESRNMPAQCFYYDVNQCIRAASVAGGQCTLNPQAEHVGSGHSTYCKVRSDRVSECIYDDYSSCGAAAARDQSICVRNSRKPKIPEPFKYENGVYN